VNVLWCIVLVGALGGCVNGLWCIVLVAALGGCVNGLWCIVLVGALCGGVKGLVGALCPSDCVGLCGGTGLIPLT